MLRYSIIIFCLFMGGNLVEAAENISTYSSDLVYNKLNRSGRFAGSLGLNAGVSGGESVQLTEGNPSSFKFLGSYYLSNDLGVLDFGFGGTNQRLTGERATLSTYSGTAAELAVRYKWSSGWQLGAVYNDFFQQGKYFAADQEDALFAGIQLLKEKDLSEGWFYRFGGRALTILNSVNENTAMVLIDFQFGWGPGSGRYTN